MTNILWKFLLIILSDSDNNIRFIAVSTEYKSQVKITEIHTKLFSNELKPIYYYCCICQKLSFDMLQAMF